MPLLLILKQAWPTLPHALLSKSPPAVCTGQQCSMILCSRSNDHYTTYSTCCRE